MAKVQLCDSTGDLGVLGITAHGAVEVSKHLPEKMKVTDGIDASRRGIFPGTQDPFEQWCSTFLMLQTFNKKPSHKIIFVATL